MKRKKQKSGNDERWLVTYSDLITLLMVFFVVMYSMSNISEKKYEKLAKSMNSVFSGGNGILEESANTEESEEIKPLVQTEEEKLKDIDNEISDYIDNMDLGENITTILEERGLVIRFDDSIFFDSAKADIKSEMKTKLISLSEILKKSNNYLRIEGHTDNIPISTNEFHSNWQLSSIRASNVVEFLATNCEISGEKLSSIGYGEYRPIANNNTEAGRAKNRRVDIVLLNSKYNEIEKINN